MEIKKYKISLALLLFFIPVIVLAANGGLDEAARVAGFSTDPQRASIPFVVARVINILLSLLGTLFTFLIIVAGFKWMTSSGSADKVESAKATIKNASLGLFVVLTSYIIVSYVIGSLAVSTGAALSAQEQSIWDAIIANGGI